MKCVDAYQFDDQTSNATEAPGELSGISNEIFGIGNMFEYSNQNIW